VGSEHCGPKTEGEGSDNAAWRRDLVHSVLAGPPIERYGSGMLSGPTMLIGGNALLLGSLGWEPNSTQSVEGPATFGWLFLLLFGSLVGYSLYMQLLRDLGPAKAGSFASVSPIIAVLVGVIAAGETVYALSVAGMAVMLVAAGACLYGDALEAHFAWIACNGTRIVKKTCSSSTLMR
jgi:drug/metabolite transporter (DMT)-like permease